ncbi:gluconate 2-dehydrogenase subunit 3 family protein [Temperatibacter marinus]|uniref:Gluconate 2-dehydrogenase subunit 3 family protein n=1 Tax=Temperatibacter marinus TaxID=1456591 RepID=A0AA52EFH0_9PROT|nr:gluconate 2-dehydrogenase subunit 3 family protein [Temperatibacter marinus]WND02713.1 gluconate 2-dehydrogenase subunit 3 family protein [Temperatibacter marinus]
MKITKRKFLMGLTALMGSQAVAQAGSAYEAYLSFDGPSALKFLTQSEFEVVTKIADIIIPDTETGGAEKAGVGFFIDHLFASVYSEEKAKGYKALLKVFQKENPNFLEMSLKKQTQLVAKLDDRMYAEKPITNFYKYTKQFTVMGYYTSQIGAEEELAYDPVPGPYHQVALADYPKTWST